MKKFIFSILVILSTANIYAQEMQISGGFDFSGGLSKVDSSFGFNYLGYSYIYNNKSTSAFFAPGISFIVRVFLDDNDISRGFVFRDRVNFLTNEKTNGSFSIYRNGYLFDSGKISETASISDDELTSIMDFGLGYSTRYKISKRWQFYSDLGVNFTWMDYEDYETKSASNYLGAGIFSDAAFQITLTEKFYLELGLNFIINIFSSQKGKIVIPKYNFNTNYKDAGRFDLFSTAFYIHFGRRFDLQQLGNDLLNKNTSKNTSQNSGGQEQH